MEKNDDGMKKRPRRPLWRRALAWCLWALVALVVVVVAATALVVAYLKPERLTPLVQRVANEYLDADVKVGRVELTFWSTWPRVELDVRSLEVVSRKWRAGRPELPAWGDSLLSLRRLHGALDMLPLLASGKIALYDVDVEDPAVNIVQVDARRANYDIFPPSTDNEPARVPDFSFRRFRVSGGLPVRYLSVADGVDVRLRLSELEASGADAPRYSLKIDGLATTDLGIEGVEVPRLGFGFDGKVDWDHKLPLCVAVSGMTVDLGPVRTLTSCTVDFDRELAVTDLDFRMAPTPVADIVALVPERWRGELGRVRTSALVSVSARLRRPYVVGRDVVPVADVEVRVPGGSLDYDKLRLRDVSGYVKAYVDGRDLNASTVETRLNLLGQGVDLRLAARGRDLLRDAAVRGDVHGRVDIARLPSRLLKMVPGHVTGRLTADCKFDFRKSYLTPRRLHKVYLDGQARLQHLDVNVPDFGATLYVGDLTARLGTASKWHNDSVSVDSLFTASLSIDTISASALGMTLVGARLSAGVGSQNTATSTDTSQINPIGGRVQAGRLVFQNSGDSSRIRLREVTIGGALRRYQGQGRKPQLDLRVQARSAGYRQGPTRLSLRGMDAAVTLHPGLPRVGRKMRHRMDSISALHPDWPDEQVYEAARRLRVASPSLGEQAVAGHEVLDMRVDSGMRRLLRTWDLKGRLRAERARVFTPYFPLRNTLTGLDMAFSTDSVRVERARLQSGASDFVVTGAITDIERALTSRKHRPLKLDFDVVSDTIDVNQLAAAVFAGQAFGEKAQNLNLDDEADDEAVERAVAAAAPIDSAAALVVPMNVDATLRFRAGTVLYSDFVFHALTGSMLVREGQINLHELAATTDVGSASLTALYSAPTRSDLSFAFGMQLKDFRINKVVRMVPALDTIMPLLRDISGIINADIAATTQLDSAMNLKIPTLSAAINLSGDSLVLMDAETFRTVAKWLMFKNKKLNMIDHMSVEMIVDNGTLQLFPFMFNMDRYKLGVMGSNDLALNFNYHIAVLKSPLPFRFGVNLKGNPDDFKVRLGGCKFNEKSPALSVAIADSTRINLLNQIENVFRRGVRNAPLRTLQPGAGAPRPDAGQEETIAPADSLYLRRQGLME